jgi:hypothetical protein
VSTRHDRDCCCRQCLLVLADAVDEIATMALAAQIQASWEGWPVDAIGPYAGYQPWLPVIPTNAWLLWFARDDWPRRQLIIAKVEVLNEAQRLIAR